MNWRLQATLAQRVDVVASHYLISARLISPHTTDEILSFCQAVLSVPAGQAGVVVEAGSYKGSSSAKFSVAARIASRKLVVCDSFRGLPAFDEVHGLSITGRPVRFHEGEFCGSLDEVQQNIRRYGAPDVCRYVEGWFEESLAEWNSAIVAVYLDVDLAASARTCLRLLYPWVVKGGVVYSQDGHLPLVLDVFRDQHLWRNELGAEIPHVHNFGQQKLIWLRKPE